MYRHRDNRNKGQNVTDIRKPERSHGFSGSRLSKTDFSNIHIPRSKRGIKIFSALVAVAVMALLLGGGYLLLLRNEAARSTNALFEGLSTMVYGPFAPSNPSQNAGENQGAVPPKYGFNFLGILPIFRDIPTGFADMQKFAGLLVQTQVSLTELRSTGLSLFLDGRGSQLLAQLSNLDTDLKGLSSTGDSIRNIASEFSALTPDAATNYFSTGADLQRETDALDSLIALLGQPNSHILVLFENTDIQRPGGGRISAYADATISNGSMIGFTVSDINSLQAYDQKVVPPMQLQTVETSWKLRDLDWFPDFPTSAAKIISRIEEAEQFQGSPQTYVGAIAVSPRVVQDMVNVLGPVQLANGKNVTAVNFNTEVTQLGYVNFLNQFLTAVEKRASDLSGDEKANMLGVASDWIANRDVRVYFSDPKLEGLVNQYDLGGQTYTTMSGYVGDYLSVVHTDIGGGSIIPDSLSLNSSIGTDGTVSNDLSITRRNQNPYVNQEYFQVMVPSGSKLVSVIGNTHNTITPLMNYKQSGYIEDPDIVNIEATREVDPDSLAESYSIPGHEVFGFWFSLPPGATGTVSVTYDSPQISLESGESYQFVIERQPGENANIIYSVQAPQGWQWQQANDPMYLYSSENLPGRTTLNINLVKNGS